MNRLCSAPKVPADTLQASPLVFQDGALKMRELAEQINWINLGKCANLIQFYSVPVALFF